MSTSASIKGDARELLLSVGEKLFADYGFDKTSIRMIANTAGLNLALISYYFGSKQAFLKQIFKIRLLQLNLAMQHIPQLTITAPAKLMEFLEVYAATFANDHFYRLLHREIAFLEISSVKEQITSYFDDTLQVLKILVEDGVKHGYFKTTDTHFVYLTIFGMLPMMISGSPVIDIINNKLHPGEEAFTIEKIKDHLYQILQNNQTEYIYRS